jgi:hypothetical protein
MYFNITFPFRLNACVLTPSAFLQFFRVKLLDEFLTTLAISTYPIHSPTLYFIIYFRVKTTKYQAVGMKCPLVSVVSFLFLPTNFQYSIIPSLLQSNILRCPIIAFLSHPDISATNSPKTHSIYITSQVIFKITFISYFI